MYKILAQALLRKNLKACASVRVSTHILLFGLLRLERTFLILPILVLRYVSKFQSVK